MVKKSSFQQLRILTPVKLALARLILEDVRAGLPVLEAVRQHPEAAGHVNKSALVAAYYKLVEKGEWEADEAILAAIRLKPVRTLSGVTTVTVLTKPYPCPGTCIFCPDDIRMPKSYLPDEPGAMRALEHGFDPYTQVRSRLEALTSVGHPTDKVELLILGGTFSSYRRDYQESFVRRCFEAMNAAISSPDFSSENGGNEGGGVRDVQLLNESAPHRNVGLSVETRPDEVTPEELAWFRSLGVTKVQMGVQSLDDHILELNQRGHTAAEALRATALLRAAGFKIVLHWMPNLLGATPDSDRLDFSRLWKGFCPDELKIYPTQLLESTPLYDYWQRGEYHPYSTEELVNPVGGCEALHPAILPCQPRYPRYPLNRMLSPGTNAAVCRQDAQAEMARRGTHCECIRCREVRGGKVEAASLRLDDLVYHPEGAEEHFLSFVTPEDKITGFLRLSLPGPDSALANGWLI